MNKSALISIALGLAIIAAWYVLMGRPLTYQISDAQKKIKVADKKAVTYQQVLERFKDQISEYRRVNDSLKTVSVSYSGKEEVVGLYREIDSLCNQPGFELEDITPSLEEVIRFLRQWAVADSSINIPIRIEVNGEYRSLAGLIKTIEQRRYFAGLQRCHISGSENLRPLCRLELTFEAGLGNPAGKFDFE